ncbi:hypothetical protein [Spirosoma litoris]
MQKLKLLLYREQFRQLVLFVPDPGHISNWKTINESLAILLLLEWRVKLNSLQILTWQRRPANKRYPFTIPLTVGLALWQELQRQRVSPELLAVIAELDKALMNAGLKS